jgi:hypothetical protein
MPKEVFNARTLIVASSIAAITIIGGLLYVTIYQKRRRRTKALSIDSGREPKQRKTEKIIPMQTLQPIGQQQPLQKVEKTQIRTAVTAAAAAAVDSSIEASKERPTTITTTTSTAVPMQEQQRISPEAPVSTKARQAGESLKKMFVTAAREAKGSAKKTGRRLKEQTVDIAATADSKDIHSLGSDVENMTGLFEDMIAEIRKEGYDEQVTLLDSYKRLLQKQIRVLDARRKLASKLKPGA